MIITDCYFHSNQIFLLLSQLSCCPRGGVSRARPLGVSSWSLPLWMKPLKCFSWFESRGQKVRLMGVPLPLKMVHFSCGFFCLWLRTLSRICLSPGTCRSNSDYLVLVLQVNLTLCLVSRRIRLRNSANLWWRMLSGLSFSFLRCKFVQRVKLIIICDCTNDNVW